MPPKLALAVVLGVSLLFATLAAAQDQAGDSKSPMGIRMVPVPADVFSTVDITDREGARKPKAGVHPLDGRTNCFDVREFLAQYGISFPSGSVADYDGGVLLVRNTAVNLALVDRVFGKGLGVAANYTEPSIQFSTYECALPASGKVLPWDDLTFADIAKLPPGAAKLVDTNLVITHSGQRCVSNHLIDPKDKKEERESNTQSGPPPQPTFQDGGTGSLLELEPVIASDGETIDTNTSHRVRLPQPGAGAKGCTELHFVTSFSTWDGYPVVLHTAPVANEPGKYFVVVALAKLIGANESKLPPPEAGVKPGTVADAKEGAVGLPAHMIMKRYRVPPGFLSNAGPGAPPGPMDVKTYLKDSGVKFPPGSDAAFDAGASTLIIINTEENLNLVDQIVDNLNSTVPELLSCELSAYECDFADIKDPAAVAKITFADLEKRPGDSVKAIDCVSIITKSGQRVATYDAAQPDASKGTDENLHEGEIGTMLEVEPVIGPDGQKVDANVEFTIQAPVGGEDGREIQKISRKLLPFTVQAGTPRVVMVEPVKDQGGKYLVFVMRFRVLTPGGWVQKVKAAGALAPLVPNSQ